MNFISYAQNCEDVLLWRALKHIKNGFYIDVGANDPELDSVTKSFYERGWYGINIEPMPEFCQRFETERPRDINLSIAAGAEEGVITLFDVPARRGWASPEKSVALQHQQEGFEVVELKVAVKTLSDICRQHVSGEIHFLKVDVEGFETAVLQGMDFSQWRPWIVLVEATLPNTRIPNHQQWEHLLTDERYQFAYFDGINRYYVADEHANLLDVLAVQANFLDDYVPVYAVKMWEAENTARDAHMRQKQLEENINIALAQAEQALIKANDAMDLVHRTEAEKHAAERNAADIQMIAERAQVQACAAAARADLADAQSLAAAAEVKLADERTAAANAAASVSDKTAAATAAWAHNVETQINQLQASLSWRVTRPLRAISLGYRRHIIEQPFAPRAWRALRIALKQQIGRTVRWIISREVLRRSLMPQLARLPWLDRQLTRVVGKLRDSPPPPPLDPISASLPEHLRDLPLSARKVLGDLQRAHDTSGRA